ncbi:MAG: DUF1428 domain-containing protein [Pseudomonadota bacterium]
MTYVDGFVIAVPTENKSAYQAHAETSAAVLKEHGALKLVECWGDDVPKGEVTDFYGAVQAKEGETIVFAWLTWPDKATRDAAMPKIMADPRMQPDTNPMPYDGKRMIFGGFEMMLDA